MNALTSLIGSPHLIAASDPPVLVAVALVGGILLGAAGVSVIIQRKWADPVHRLARTAGELAGGRWAARTQVGGADEVRRLGMQINALAEDAQARFAALADQTASLKLLVDALPDPILLSDARDRIVLINAPAERLLQLPPQQVLGKPFVAAVNDPAIVDLFEFCTRNRRADRPQTLDREIKLLRRGQRIMFQAHAEPTQMGGLLIVLRDVSTLAATIQMKTDFVANASHELRTPISAIKVAFETLRDVHREQAASAPDDALGNRCITIIGDHLRRLEEMLRDLLDLSRVESADLKPQLAPVRVRELMMTIRAVWQPIAREKGVELSLPDGEDLVFASDRRLLDLVVKNLVENAIKFTPSGGRVDVTCEPRTAEDALLPTAMVLTVADTGCGIPTEHAERVFERFYQVDAARSGTAGRGTGLGLAIVKHAVHALSGQISLTSRPGAGTRITCVLPTLDPPSVERA